MGCFNSTKNSKQPQLSNNICHYPRSYKIPIKMRNITGAVVGTQTVSFIVTEPVLLSSKLLSTSTEKLQISSCVLPGLDPRGEYKKSCQDNCFYLYDSDNILCCLFDGHGKEGEKVASFCERIISNLFSHKKQIMRVNSKQDNPEIFMKMATEKCDTELKKKSSGIDCDYSGW